MPEISEGSHERAGHAAPAGERRPAVPRGRQRPAASYGLHALAGWAIVTVVGIVQHVVVLGVAVDPARLILPMLVGAGAGLLVARQRAMARRIAEQIETIQATEEELRALNETLEERVLARSQQLRAQEAALAEARRVESVGRLAGGLAHDFNNILTVILLAADEVDQRLSTGTDDQGAGEVRAVAGEITAAAKRAASLTRQLLMYARRDQVHHERFDVRDTVQALRPMLGRLLGGGVEFVCRLPDVPCTVEMDPGQLEQVLVNLATNAAEAMDHQGRLELALAVDEAADEVLLRVTDDGAGMSPEVRDQAFEAFYTTKELGRGTGLGLATVHGIVLGAGGRISLESTAGQGTTFAISLPRATVSARGLGQALGAPGADDGAGGDVSADGAPGSPSAAAPLVLLVDDEDVVRGVTRRVLMSRGYRVLEGRHGAEAVAVLRERGGAVDLVVTDRVMPVMGGAALLAELSRSWPSLPVVVVSAHAEGELPPRPPGAAAVYSVSKPYGVRELCATIERALAG